MKMVGQKGAGKLGATDSMEQSALPCSFIRGFVYAKSVSQIGLIRK